MNWLPQEERALSRRRRVRAWSAKSAALIIFAVLAVCTSLYLGVNFVFGETVFVEREYPTNEDYCEAYERGEVAMSKAGATFCTSTP